uniref:Reverse transcriptase domain-containing protein n=1 Tax=Tanacetum cinerariifolium TaxID=118510 RepID=A0A6L2MRR4_TANCI|nr:reverse transcriptase domain-containing protein [Tanacetum cinerariifolium]
MRDNQEVLNATAGGIFLYKTPNQAYKLLEDKVLIKLEWAKNQKTKLSLKKIVSFTDEGSSNSDTNKIMARMDVVTLKMDAQYKELQTHAKKVKPIINEDDIPMSREEEAKFMQTFFGMPNYGKFLKELISNKHKIEQISAAFLSDESSSMIQNKVSPKLGDPESFLIPCNFNKTFSYNALADLGASINLMPYLLYAKLSLETLKPTKMSVRLADRSFQYFVGIAKNMLVEVGKFTFPADFVILEMEEDSKVPLIFGRPIDVIDEILEEDFDALLDEGSKILHSIEGTLIEEEIFAEFDEFLAMTADKNSDSDSESDTEEPSFEKITINTIWGFSVNFAKFQDNRTDNKKKEKLLQLEQWANLSTHPSKCFNSFCYDDDDDEDYTSAVTPSLSIEEPGNSLSMGDEHLDTIPAMESDEVIKSSVENLITIPSESEGIPEHMCDVPFHDNSPPLDVLKDQFDDLSDSNEEFSSIDDDSFSIDNIDYVEASPPDSELVSSEVMEIVIPEVGGIDDDILLTIKDDILHEKLLNANLLISKIEALNDNPTPSSDFKTKSSSTSFNSLLEETNTFDNSLPEFKTFCFEVEEISSGSTTTHSDSSFYASFIFDLSINPFPPADRSDFYESADELIPFISPPEYDCFLFKVKPNSRDFTKDVVEDISPTIKPKVHNALPTYPTLQLNLKFQPSSEFLFTYVVWIFLPFLVYSVSPHYLLSLRNEATIFDPGICTYHFSRPEVSHRCGTFPRFNVLPESPMEIFSSTCSPMDK